MLFEKAVIQKIDEKGEKIGNPIAVLYNPTEYTIECGNQFQETVIPGLAGPVTHFISGNSKTLSIELFFDTSENREDVRNYTKEIVNLLNKNEKLHAPPICKLTWDKNFEFKGVLERLTQRYTMFLESGVPVRAFLNCTFKEYKTISEQIEDTSKQSQEGVKKKTIGAGDQLWMIAFSECGAASEWRAIAEANKIDNPRNLKTVKELAIPAKI